MRAFIVDAFTDRPFAGNPAGVCLLDRPADAAWMQRVAAEFNLSETAFVHRTAENTYGLRWFTPTVEVDLCGHATLATAHVLHTTRSAAPDAALHFTTLSGVLTARRHDQGAISLDFPADAPTATPNRRSWPRLSVPSRGGPAGPGTICSWNCRMRQRYVT